MMPRAGDDVDAIMSVMTAAFDPAYGEAWTRRQVEDALIIGNCHYGLADAGARCAGFFLTRKALDEEELLLIAVHPEFRGRGYGKALLQRFCDAARGRGAARLLLEMRSGNPAERLYRSAGFEQVGLRPNYYRAPNGERLDALTFACKI